MLGTKLVVPPCIVQRSMVLFGRWPPSLWGIAVAAVLIVAWALSALFSAIVAVAFVVVVLFLVIYATMNRA
jgi:hypothetical protein